MSLTIKFTSSPIGFNEDKHLFYTACTRTLHELHIFTNTSLEEILPKDSSLYSIIE